MAAGDINRYATMLLGMEFVTREMHFYTIFETVYMDKSSDAVDELRGNLVKAYEKMLGYLAKAMKFFSKSSKSIQNNILALFFNDCGSTSQPF
jgi:hypothetical protein